MATPLSVPEDIERLIFERAAADQLETVLQLVLVSKRARTWIEPLMYNVIHPDKTASFVRSLILKTKPPSFYAQHVKAICFAYNSVAPTNLEDIYQTFWTCTSLKNIACWNSWDPSGDEDKRSNQEYLENHSKIVSKLISLTSKLRPRILSTRLSPFLGLGTSKPNFGGTFFEHITHLDVVDTGDEFVSWDGWELIPNMTHLSFDITSFDNDPDRFRNARFVPFVKEKVLRCKSLQTLIILDHDETEDGTEPLLMAIADPRAVIMRYPENASNDWYVGPGAGCLGTSLWDLADAEVARRRASTSPDFYAAAYNPNALVTHES